jgi:hypothetical protein
MNRCRLALTLEITSFPGLQQLPHHPLHLTSYCSQTTSTSRYQLHFFSLLLILDRSPSRYILSLAFGDKEADIMVADALIYHPTVSHYLKFVATTGTILYAISYTCITSDLIPSLTLLPLSHHYVHPLPMLQLTTPSRPRQSPSYPPILLALPRLVPLPHKPCAIQHLALRGNQKTVRPCA